MLLTNRFTIFNTFELHEIADEFDRLADDGDALLTTDERASLTAAVQHLRNVIADVLVDETLGGLQTTTTERH